MSDETVLVHFRLDPGAPIRVTWIAGDGSPLTEDGYKAQITGIELADGTSLIMDPSAILEQVARDPFGDLADYLVTFTGMVGFPKDHANRARVDQIVEEPISYVLAFVHGSGRVAVEGTDYKIDDRPKGMAKKLGPKA